MKDKILSISPIHKTKSIGRIQNIQQLTAKKQNDLQSLRANEWNSSLQITVIKKSDVFILILKETLFCKLLVNC
jgi:hypothetical protein